MRELDAVVDAVVRGVGPDDGPDLADAGFEHDDDECLLALTFVTITHNGVATNREMTYVNI